MTPHYETNQQQPLDAREEALVAISAFTAKGDPDGLKTALDAGLDAGLTISEQKEALVQLYAYCGFPRSLNGLTGLMAVLDERKARGKHDAAGKEASPAQIGTDKYAAGKQTLELLTRRPETGAKTGVAAFAPIIDTFLKEHLFADIFSRDALSYRQRELVTIAALATLEGLAAQLQAHLGMGLNVGLTEAGLQGLFAVVEKASGKAAADAGRALLATVIAGRENQ